MVVFRKNGPSGGVMIDLNAHKPLFFTESFYIKDHDLMRQFCCHEIRLVD